ncbi:MAG: hypothetical protein FJZ78_04790 [Bacteroidetes bacterium]|nr:hypothetical protein [Bacteroidota bacterium]
MRALLKIFLFILSLASLKAYGQDEKIIGTIWKSESVFSVTDGNLITYKGIWKIHADRIEWLQPGQKYNYVFQLKDLIGDWDRDSQTGKISAGVIFREHEGKIDFIRNTEESTLKISIQSDEGEFFPFRFNISTIGKN